jgi:hypothetical protein
MTTLVFSHQDWQKIRIRITEEYGPTFFLIRSRVERELGFTSRNHREWYHNSGWNKDIRLDFRDPTRATFFQIKYL